MVTNGPMSGEERRAVMEAAEWAERHHRYCSAFGACQPATLGVIARRYLALTPPGPQRAEWKASDKDREVTRDEVVQAVGGLYWVVPGVGRLTMEEGTALALLAAAGRYLALTAEDQIGILNSEAYWRELYEQERDQFEAFLRGVWTATSPDKPDSWQSIEMVHERVAAVVRERNSLLLDVGDVKRCCGHALCSKCRAEVDYALNGRPTTALAAGAGAVNEVNGMEEFDDDDE